MCAYNVEMKSEVPRNSSEVLVWQIISGNILMQKGIYVYVYMYIDVQHADM